MKFDIFKNEPNKNGLAYFIKYNYNKDGDLTSVEWDEYKKTETVIADEREYYHSPDWDEYGGIHQCLKCGNLMEVEYEKWSDELLLNESNCPSCDKSFEIGEYGRGLNYCKKCQLRIGIASLE